MLNFDSISSIFFSYKSSLKCQTVFQSYQENFEWNAANTPHKLQI